MKTLALASLLVVTNAVAIDFDTEWAAFKADFVRLKPVATVVEPSVVSKVVAPVVTADQLTTVDPKSPERLGHTITDPTVRALVTELYKKPDTVVLSTTIR
jgi:hypothetical protein